MPRLLKIGKRGDDVKQIQSLLNSAKNLNRPKLVEDGVFGAKTDARTRAFQRKEGLKVDGIVGPKTRAKLHMAQFVGPVPPPGWEPPPPPKVPKQPDPTPKGRDEPRLLSPGEIVNFVEPGTHGNWKIDTFTGRALAGQCYMSFTGRRLLIEVLQGAVVYLIVDSEKPFYRGLMFAQSKKGFISDVKYWAFTEGAKGAQGMKTIAEWEAAIGYGIATKLNAAAWVACVGVAGLVFFDTHRHKFAAYRAALTELMLARDVLRGHCPTLYNELFDYVLYNTLKNIPTAFARDPNIMGVVLGSLIGFALKVRKLDERRDIVFEVSKLLLGVAWNVMKSLPGTGEETAEETAEKMVEILRTRNVNFSKVKAVKIVMEVKENAHAVEYSLKRIHKAWELVK